MDLKNTPKRCNGWNECLEAFWILEATFQYKTSVETPRKKVKIVAIIYIQWKASPKTKVKGNGSMLSILERKAKTKNINLPLK
jgi:hypothetical protein